MQPTPARPILTRCRDRWRELLFAAALVALSGLAVYAGLRYGRAPRPMGDLPSRGSGELPRAAESEGETATTEASTESYFVVEDALTGRIAKRDRQSRGPDFRRWTRYRILDSYELAGRLVAGKKESKSVVVRIQPKSLQVPTAEQLEEIGESLRSEQHHSTYVYFYLPGMDTQQGPWATVFQQSSRPTSVSFDKTHVPPLYRRFEEQVWK
jgi:hypothetical protein